MWPVFATKNFCGGKKEKVSVTSKLIFLLFLNFFNRFRFQRFHDEDDEISDFPFFAHLCEFWPNFRIPCGSRFRLDSLRRLERCGDDTRSDRKTKSRNFCWKIFLLEKMWMAMCRWSLGPKKEATTRFDETAAIIELTNFWRISFYMVQMNLIFSLTCDLWPVNCDLWPLTIQIFNCNQM